MKYHDYRKKYWAEQGGDEVYDLVDFGNSKMKNGDPLNAVYLQPKVNLIFKDIWVCPDKVTAIKVLHRISECTDLDEVKLSGRWVWVGWTHQGKDHILEGQKKEGRTRYLGR